MSATSPSSFSNARVKTDERTSEVEQLRLLLELHGPLPPPPPRCQRVARPSDAILELPVGRPSDGNVLVPVAA